jgi:hypothetical protein
MEVMLMSRWKAAGIHLAISFVIGALILSLILLVWYPQPYFQALGARHLILLLLGVDLVLGPLLTLIVFDTNKKSLRFDLSVIALMQTAALVYGLYVTAHSRPVFIVGAEDKFVVVIASEIDPEDLAEGSSEEFRSLPWTGPKLVAAVAPTDEDRTSRLVASAFIGKEMANFPDLYTDYSNQAKNMLTDAKALSALPQDNGQTSKTVQAWLQSNGHTESDVVWLPILSREGSLTMLLDAKTGMPLAALPIDPG